MSAMTLKRPALLFHWTSPSPRKFEVVWIGVAAAKPSSDARKELTEKRRKYVTYSVPSTERLLNAKHFSRLPPKSVARQEALWQDTLREGSVRALCQGREYNSSGLNCHLKEAVRARNSIAFDPGAQIGCSCPRANP